MTSAKGLTFIILSSVMFASYGVWAKLIGDDMGAFYQGWTRGLVLTIVLFPILYLRKEIIVIERKDWKWLGVFIVFTSLTQAPLFYAFTHMDIGSATLLFFVSMLLTMYTVGIFFLGEKLNQVKILSFLLAVAGLYFTFSFSIVAFTLFAALMAITNGIASGGEISFSKKLSGNYSVLYLSWISWIAILLTNLPLSLLLGETQILPTFEMLWVWQGAYILTSALGFWFIMEGLKYVEASIGGLLGLLEIIFSIALGIVLFNEGLSGRIILGAALILLAASLPHIQTLRFSREQKQGRGV